MKKTMAVLILILGISVSTAQAAFFDKDAAPAPQPVSQPDGQSFEQIMNMLSINCALWGQLSAENKKRAIDAVILLYRMRDNIAILGSSDFYVGKVNETLASNSAIMNLDLPQVIKILAVMDYDFYNGQNKEELAKQTLGEKMYESNKMRKMASGR